MVQWRRTGRQRSDREVEIREFSEFRELREFREFRERLRPKTLNSLNSLNTPIINPYFYRINIAF